MNARLTTLMTVVSLQVFASAANAQPSHLIFVTSNLYNLDPDKNSPPLANSFGSLEAADILVTREAQAAGLISGWNEGDPPRFRAVLSDSTIDARDRLDIQGPIYNIQGELVANDANDLWDGMLTNAARYTVDGTELTLSARVWTGTKGDGTTSGANCTDWCGTAGNTGAGIPIQTNSAWVQSIALSCGGTARLYGISQFVIPEPASVLLLATAALALVSPPAAGDQFSMAAWHPGEV